VTRRIRLVALLIPLALACASAGRSGVAGGPRHDSFLITESELRQTNVANLYDAIRTLRPEWIARRNPTTLRPEAEGNIVVYMDRIRFGELEVLRSFAPALATSVRYLAPAEAEAEFGPGHLQGAILVTTGRR